jgi:translation initiation factor 1
MPKLNSLSDLKSLFPEAEGAYQPEPKTKKQNLEAHFSNKGRGGKTVTVIKGFVGSPSALKALEKELKSLCAVGGSVKNDEIIIQGNFRDKIMVHLQKQGHNVKRVGG